VERVVSASDMIHPRDHLIGRKNTGRVDDPRRVDGLYRAKVTQTLDPVAVVLTLGERPAECECAEWNAGTDRPCSPASPASATGTTALRSN